MTDKSPKEQAELSLRIHKANLKVLRREKPDSFCMELAEGEYRKAKADLAAFKSDADIQAEAEAKRLEELAIQETGRAANDFMNNFYKERGYA